MPLLGPTRSARAMPFKAIDDAGATQAFGSDYPVFSMDPLLGIYTAVTRQLPDGTPSGGWQPQHRISVERALKHYTWGSAYAAFRENEIGVLKVGYYADLVVLSEDILVRDPQAPSICSTHAPSGTGSASSPENRERPRSRCSPLSIMCSARFRPTAML